MKRIEPKGKWMMVDGFNTVEGPDHRGYIEIFGWLNDEPQDKPLDTIPILGTNAALVILDDDDQGMPVSVDGTCQIYEHAGREWLYVAPAPPPVSERKMPNG